MSLLSRLIGVFRAEKHYAELDEELKFHIDERTDELVASGMSREDARREAFRRFGHYASQREAVRDVDVLRPVEAFVGDLRYGARQLRLNPGFAIVAVLSLALGIGANSAIFQLIHALQIRPLPVRDAESLVALDRGPDFYAAGRFSGRNTSFTYPQFEQLQASQRAFSSLVAFSTTRFNLSRGGEGRFASGLFVTPDFFTELGVEPLWGSGFSEQANPKDCAQAGAVVDYRFWQQELGADPAVIGRELSLDGVVLPIVGVTPSHFFGLEPARRFDVAVPLCVEALVAESWGSRMDNEAAWWLVVIGLLKPGFSIEGASGHVLDLSPGLFRATVPEAYRAEEAGAYLENTLRVVSAATGVSSVRQEYRNPLWILLTSTCLVLLLACANLANLLLARASAREREISLRQAVGASRPRLIAQLMAESLLLATCGAALGVFVAQALSKVLVLFLDAGSGQLDIRLTVHWHIVGFTAALAALTCLLFGLAPAVRASGAAPADAMRGGRGTEGSGQGHGLRRALVVTQIGLSLVLLVGALLFGQSLRNLLSSETGLESGGVLLARVEAGSVPADRRLSVFAQLEERFSAVSEVASASSVFFTPFSGASWNQEAYAGDGSPDEAEMAWFNRVGAGYFSTLGTRLLAGREFTPRDDSSAAPVAIVNQQLAHDLFGEQNPVGRTLRYRGAAGGEDPGFEIVGVVGNSKYFELRDEELPFAYLPVAQQDSPIDAMGYALRVRGTSAGVRAGIEEQMAGVDGSLMVEYRMLDEMIQGSVRRERLMANLSAGFGVLAVLLSSLGLYGVMSYIVACRRRELGVRLAMGASVRHLVGLLTTEAGRLVLLGLLCGLAGSFALTRFAGSLLYGLPPNDPVTLLAGSALLVATACAALLVPLRRAASCDPAVVLRDE
ncbi:MAG: ABC transporter permease [Thermoanaerobaculia bacterium]|nr:ABC transporter permease [Thermoanaerobaculia bacterium]